MNLQAWEQMYNLELVDILSFSSVQMYLICDLSAGDVEIWSY